MAQEDTKALEALEALQRHLVMHESRPKDRQVVVKALVSLHDVHDRMSAEP